MNWIVRLIAFFGLNDEKMNWKTRVCVSIGGMLALFVAYLMVLYIMNHWWDCVVAVYNNQIWWTDWGIGAPWVFFVWVAKSVMALLASVILLFPPWLFLTLLYVAPPMILNWFPEMWKGWPE